MTFVPPFPVTVAHRTITRLLYERRTGQDWHLAEVDPATDPFYLGLVHGYFRRVGPDRPDDAQTVEALDRILGERPGDAPRRED